MNILETYEKLLKYLFKRQIFNFSIGYRAPFFGKIRPPVVKLEPGYCVIHMNDRRALQNHIGTINAGAMCTLVELTAGLAVNSAIAKHLSWLPKGMNVSYLKKEQGKLRAMCKFDTSLIQIGYILIPLEIKDSEDDVVLVAEITCYISKKKKR